jgi:hypothetical protein
MKKQVFTIGIIMLIVLPTFAQSYKITEDNTLYGIVDDKGNTIFPHKYAWITSCKYAPEFFIADREADEYFILHPKTRKRIAISEFEYELELDYECLIPKGRLLRFNEKKKVGLLSFPDSIILPAKYKMIYPFPDYENVYLLQQKKKYKILNRETGFQSDWFEMLYSIESLYIDDNFAFLQSEEYFFAEFDDELKMINLKGDEYILPKTDEGEYFPEESDIYLAYKDGKYGYVDYHGGIIIPFQYEDAGTRSFSSDLMYVKIGEKYCYIDSYGTIILPCIYDKAGPFIDSYAEVIIDGKTFQIDDFGEREDWIEPIPKDEEVSIENAKWGYKNSKGDLIIDYIFEDAGMFSFGLAPAKKGGKWGFISQVGSTVIDFQFEEADGFYNGVARCKKDGKWGYINFSGEFVIDNIFEYADNFRTYSNMARVGKKVNGTMLYGAIDLKGNLTINYMYEDIDLYASNAFAVKKNGKWGYIDKKNRTIIDFIYDQAKEMSSDRAPVKMNEKWGFIDKTGNQITEFIFDDVKSFYNSVAPVKIGDKWGYINKAGEMIIEAQYDEAGHFYYLSARVKKDGKSFSINKQGEIVK